MFTNMRRAFDIDTTISIRVTDEQKAKFSELAEKSGLKAGDMLQTMINAYELNRATELSSEVQADLAELQTNTNRINAIVLNIIERNFTYKAEQSQMHQEELEQKDTSLNVCNSRIKDLEVQIQALKVEKEIAEKDIREHVKQISEMEKTAQSTAALITEYKEKNDTLAGMLSEYKQAKVDMETVKQELYQERELRRQSDANTRDAAKEIQDLKDYISSLKTEHDAKVELLKDANKQEVDKIVMKAELDREKAILNLKVVHQKEINELHSHYTSKIQEVLFKNIENPLGE